MIYGYDYYYPYDYSTNSIDLSSIAGILAVFGIVIFLAIAISLTVYVFYAISLYTLANKRGMKNTFLAFIPIANTYFLGKITDDICRTMNQKTNYAQKLLVFNIISVAASIILSPLLLVAGLLRNVAVLLVVVMLFYLLILLANVCYLVFFYIALYKIYKEYAPNNAVLFEIISIIVNISHPFILFAIRNNKSGYELWCEERRVQSEASEPVVESTELNEEVQYESSSDELEEVVIEVADSEDNNINDVSCEQEIDAVTTLDEYNNPQE